MKILFTIVTILSLQVAAQSSQTTWTLQELGRASSALLVGMDRTLEKKSFCQLDSAQISQASQALKSLIDSRLQHIGNKIDVVQKLMKNCIRDCTCDTYEYALEKWSDGDLGASSFAPLTMEQRLICFSKFKGFCQSKLFKTISR